MKTERQARPPNELCFAGKYGWNDGKSGKDGKVLLSEPFSEIKSRPGHNETDSETKAQWDVPPEDAECVVGAGEAVLMTRQSTEYLWDCDSDNEYEEIAS